MSNPGAKRASVDCAMDLKQQLHVASRPSHLPTDVHALVDREICCAFSDRRPDPITGMVSLAVVGQPRDLATEIFIDRKQTVPQLMRPARLR
jgi:hypothetical protein